ncbi:MAG: FkbM family methyltransferase [bacterium]|nr:FkbM family methyltransferase [bacterium]
MSSPAISLPWRWRLLQGYVRRELPGWGRLYAALGGHDEARWQNAGIRTSEGKLHGYRMPLDLSNWSERLSYFLGRYHDLPLQLAMRLAVRPGDTFVDVGANLGMITLLACRLVGDSGRVLACEPNPRLADRLETLARDNAIEHLGVARTALGEAAGTAELTVFSDHTGWGSLVAAAPDGGVATERVEVPVSTGDTLLGAKGTVPGTGPLVLKIDVEGYEIEALRGLRATLAERRPLVFVEAVAEHLERAGHSLAALRELLESNDFAGYRLRSVRTGITGSRLVAEPIETADPSAPDAVFVPNGSEFEARLAAATSAAAKSAEAKSAEAKSARDS